MNIGIFISGSGSNMEAILRKHREGYFSALEKVSFVLSDRSAAPGLEKAARFGVPTLVVPRKKGETREEHEVRIREAIAPHSIGLLVLAGFMRVLSASFLRSLGIPVINIHPSLLPSFTGVDAQHRAFDYGVKVSGCTVHFVDESLDGGPILLQQPILRRNEDTVEDFKNRILAEEHRLLSEAIEIVTTGAYSINNRYVHVERRHEN